MLAGGKGGIPVWRGCRGWGESKERGRFCVTRAGNKLQRFLDGMLLFSHMLLGFMQEVTGQGLWTALPEEVWSDEQHLMA